MKYVALAYHRIGEGDEFYSLKEAVLLQHLGYLRAQGVPVVAPGGAPVAAKRSAVVLTFDGCSSAEWLYTRVTPILLENGLRAFFFLTTSLVGTPDYLSRHQVRELAELGMVIGSHSHTHPVLPRLSLEQVSYELQRSKGVLEDITGQPIGSFALPEGNQSSAVFEAAREAGYRWVFTSAWGFNQFKDDPWLQDFLIWRRFAITRLTALGEYQRMVNGQGGLLLGGKYLLKEGFKALVGEERYKKVRRRWPWEGVRP